MRDGCHCVAELFADNIRWYVPGEPALPWSGKRTKNSEVAPFFPELWPWAVLGESRLHTAKLMLMTIKR